MSRPPLEAPSVIVVEDNETLRQELIQFLADEGMDVRGVGTGEELNDALQIRPAHILIMDLNLPGEDGIRITRRIRSALPGVGIIILSARVRSTDRLEGYATGADVYLTKPTRPAELVAVVRNLHSRLGASALGASWSLDMAALLLQPPQGPGIQLTGAEALLLQALTLNGQFMDHAGLMTRFGDALQSEKINKARIEVLVSRLRSKLGAQAGGGMGIRALRGRGYQLGVQLVLKNLNSVR